MNYISQLQAFDQWQELNELSASAVALWFALMQTANRAGWKTPFTVAISVLEHRSGLERRSLYRARNTLKQAGLIDFKERGSNRAAEYEISVLYGENDTHSVTQSVTHPVTHSVTHPVTHSVTITKPNKTKQDIKKSKKESQEEKQERKKETALDLAIEDFKEHRKKMRAPLTDRALELFMQRLNVLGKTDEEKIAIINQSIIGGYRGIFELKQDDPRRDQAAKKRVGAHAPYKQTQLTEDDFAGMFVNLDSDECLKGAANES